MMKKTTRNYLWVLLANFLLIAAVGVIWQTRLHAETPFRPVQKGSMAFIKLKAKPEPLPDVGYLKGLEAQARLTDLKGHWTILNLWATWCPPCVAELPSLQLLSLMYESQGVKVVGISLDDAASVDELKQKIARAGLSKVTVAKNWDEKGEIANTLWPESLPTTLIINPAGEIVASLSGDAQWASLDAQAFVESLLKASPPVQAQP